MHDQKSELEKAIKAIKETISPVSIYLFGSYAYGTPDEDSDLDLCVIAETLSERKIDVLRNIRWAMVDSVTMPVDLLVYTAAEFNERAAMSASMEHDILNNGVQIYGQ